MLPPAEPETAPDEMLPPTEPDTAPDEMMPPPDADTVPDGETEQEFEELHPLEDLLDAEEDL